MFKDVSAYGHRVSLLFNFELLNLSNFVLPDHFNFLLKPGLSPLFFVLDDLSESVFFSSLKVDPRNLHFQVSFIFDHNLLDFEGLGACLVNLFECALLFFLKHAHAIL